MDFQFLLLKKENPVWILQINRPEALNALNSQLLNELSQALLLVEKAFPKECRGLIITGAGEKAFVAGADIKEMQGLGIEAARQFSEKGQSIFRQIENLSVPVLAAVNGFALGGGLELALACDFIYASENAKLGLPEVSLGLLPGFGGTVRLSRLVGLNIAREIIFSAGMLGAEEALKKGLVNQVVPASELLPLATKTLQTISTRGPLAIRSAKKIILQGFDQDMTLALKNEAQTFSELFITADMTEGTGAFLQKRKAIFQGV